MVNRVPMQHDLDRLSTQAMSLITTLASKKDAAAIARVAATANRIVQLQGQLSEIDSEIQRIRQTLAAYEPRPDVPLPPSVPTQGQGTGVDDAASDAAASTRLVRHALRIQVDWGRIGKSRGIEVISEHKASDTQAKWAERVYEELGPEALEKLAHFRISRGPMVSRNPERDFLNRASGALFSYQPVGRSGFFILTHSQTSQKVADLKAASKLLGFPVGSVLVEEVAKQDRHTHLMATL